MPGIKKKWIKASHKDDSEKSIPSGGEEAAYEDRELSFTAQESTAPVTPKVKTPKRSSPSSKSGMLKGLDGEVLLEKRKRFVPNAELKLNEWLEGNIEKRTEETLSLTQLYGYYTELCQGESWDVLDVPEFNKFLKTKYGKAMGLTESSVLKGVIKERKLNKEKKKPYQGVGMKEAIHEAIHHYGNPAQGVRFFSLKQYIGTKYPALQVDIKPNMLKRYLEMGVGYSQLDLIKGIGKAGFYRISGVEPEPKEEKPKKKDDGEQPSQTDEEKEKGPEESAEDKENRENVSEEKKKEKEKKPVKYKPVKYSSLNHGSPDKVEDSFPLAITYQSAPKVASLPKIRRYIAEKYKEEVTDNRWRQVIEKGNQNGSWEHISGHGISGSIHLLMDDFDPTSSQLEDQVCAAVIACHEPKSASANQIKKYVSKYHPDFKVDERPDKFKKALLRAVSKNMIVQVSGLGANGSFQLTSTFTPSPAILAGDEDDEEESEYDSDVEENTYVPRGTKSRGAPKKTQVGQLSSSGRGRGRPAGKGRPQKRKSYNESSDEEDSHPVPSKKKSKVSPGKKSSGRGRPSKSATGRGRPRKSVTGRGRPSKREPSPLTEEEDEEEDMVEYTPRKSKSRGGSASSTPVDRRKNSQTKAKAASSGRKRQASPSPQQNSAKGKKRVVPEDSDADDEDEVPLEYTPRKSKSRGGEGNAPKQQSGGRGRKSKK